MFEHVGVGAAELEDDGAFDGVVVLEEAVAAFDVVVEGVCCVCVGWGGVCEVTIEKKAIINTRTHTHTYR